jgi:uncharacterized membrane protein YraQ (UPF0718 family)
MKIVGILVLSLVAGLLAAGVSIGTGGSLWAALINYLAVGMVATVLGLAVVIWRAWEAERPNSDMALNGAASAGK